MRYTTRTQAFHENSILAGNLYRGERIFDSPLPRPVSAEDALLPISYVASHHEPTGGSLKHARSYLNGSKYRNHRFRRSPHCQGKPVSGRRILPPIHRTSLQDIEWTGHAS